jgi:hypothetical protein
LSSFLTGGLLDAGRTILFFTVFFKKFAEKVNDPGPD